MSALLNGGPASIPAPGTPEAIAREPAGIAPRAPCPATAADSLADSFEPTGDLAPADSGSGFSIQPQPKAEQQRAIQPAAA